MKPIALVLFVALLALSVESANHHKKHKGTNVKTEDDPNEGDVYDDFEWPEPENIRNFDPPEAVRQGRFDNSPNVEAPSASRHGSRHQSHSH